MSSSGLRKKDVSQLLRDLRPIDITLGIKVYSKSPLGPMPSSDELLKPPARLFWLAALSNYAQSQLHTGLLLSDAVLLKDCIPVNDRQPLEVSTRLIDFIGTGKQLMDAFPEYVVSSDEAGVSPKAYFVYRDDAELIYLHRWFAIEVELGKYLRERLQAEAIEVPDWGAVPVCRQAVLDYRRQHGITAEIKIIDWGGVYWQKQ